MTSDHLEIFAAWKGEPGDSAAKWFEQAGFSVQRGKTGLFLHAARPAAAAALGMQSEDLQAGTLLPVPAAINQEVASITILRPREYLK